MNSRYTKRTVGMALFLVLLAARQAQAQTSYQTYVSGATGSDSNPCTRALPCKTVSPAIAQTRAGGSLYVLDAADEFRLFTVPLVIDRSISIIASGGRYGIIGRVDISPEAGGKVVLKGVDINAATGLGINVTSSAGLSLVIEDCTIFNGVTGINFTPQASSAISYLFVRNSTIYNNKSNPSGTAGGVVIQPGSTGPSVAVFAVLDNVHLTSNYFGLLTFDATNVTVRNSVASQSTLSGIRAQANSGGPVIVSVEHSQSSHNGGNGVIAVGATVTVRLHDLTATDNLYGLKSDIGGNIISFGTNAVGGNTNDGTPTSTVPLR